MLNSFSSKSKNSPSKRSLSNKKIEICNAITHGIAAVLSLLGTYLLIQKGIKKISNTDTIAYIIYGFSMVALFTNSTLYHSLSHSKYRSLLQKLDHSAIYFLIAGTYTPYLMIALNNKLAYLFLAIIWLLALAGIIFEIFAINRFPKLSTYLYLTLGWLSLIIIYPLFKSMNFWGIIYLGLGGIAYSLGTIFYSMKANRWMHVVWHLFVILGAGLMFFSIFRYL
ncbi:hemolysin III family protein [Facklamia sp. 7083-14-GEN3]|uniref:PAQR family membrane homeostasis protein TrhA n=1 Tax=Facklamia sp. 7083-14-GEN3 TaxID=2973478 RepID=UPI00215C331D|nr:hemolysin III family protein [Facklamia sp. 7083-14-GEN3]MCR8968828.1 hemolysin III family protein [Facklamia sp. 7083-14-GEN3]